MARIKKLNEQIVACVLGNRLKTHREESGLSQSRIAELIDRDRGTINRLENGDAKPTFFLLLDFAYAMECTLSDLFDGFEDEAIQLAKDLAEESRQQDLNPMDRPLDDVRSHDEDK